MASRRRRGSRQRQAAQTGPRPRTRAGAGARDRPALRIRGPADLVALVPFLLGFHPTQSLIMLGMAAHGIQVTVRMDLADLAEPGLLASTVAAMTQGGAERLVGVLVDDTAVAPDAVPARPLPWHGVVGSLRIAAEPLGVVVDDVLLVSDGRWWSMCCVLTQCCPPEGTPLADNDNLVPASAAFAGLVALPSRDTVAAQLDPVECGDGEALAVLLARAETGVAEDGRTRPGVAPLKRALFAAARAAEPLAVADADFEPVLADEDVARFGVALTRFPIRDALWLAVDDGRLDGRELWRELARRLPDRYAAPPLFLFAWTSWRLGNGALARMAVDRCVIADPSYTAADLLVAALDRGMDPRQVPLLRRAKQPA